VKIQASLPNNTSTKLTAGKPVNVPVKITNTGVTDVTYFADARLNTIGDLPLAELSGFNTDIPLPVPAGVTPNWLVPTETDQLTVAASATQPVNLDVGYQSGDPEVYGQGQGNSALVRINADQVSPGIWLANIGQHGPFAGPAPTGTVSVAAVSRGQLFDPAVTSTTGDVWQLGVDPSVNPALAAKIKAAAAARFGKNANPAGVKKAASIKAQADEPAPITLAPGQSATITVTITPTGTPGSVVHGHLYIDTFSVVTLDGDELIDLPYAYTVG
jgi:hypothetical protein